MVSVDDGLVSDVRIALGGVAHKPWRATRAEEVLRGRPPAPENFRAAAEAELAAARPQPGLDGGNGFKISLAARTIAATLRQLTEEAA
jgi:xanthine dehydrogenase YagS FAD-binding subunit